MNLTREHPADQTAFRERPVSARCNTLVSPITEVAESNASLTPAVSSLLRGALVRRAALRGPLAGLVAMLLSACPGVTEEAVVRSQREYELAVSQYREERSPTSAIVTLERSLRSNPDNAEAHLLLGSILVIEHEQQARALPHLQRAVELLRRQSTEDLQLLTQYGEARNTYAATLIAVGRPDEAVPILTELSSDVHYPSRYLALGNLGLAHITARRYREAVDPLQRAVQQRGDFCVGSYRLGEAYLRLNDDAQALTALDRALSTRAEGCDRIQSAYRARGEAHTRLHHPDEALADFTRCRDLAPSTTEGRECASRLRTVGGAPAANSSSGAPAPDAAPRATPPAAAPSAAPSGVGGGR